MMIQPTLDQTIAAVRHVQQLGDPAVQWELAPAFGPVEASKPNPAVLYVGLAGLRGEVCLRVCRYFPTDLVDTEFVKFGEVVRWHLALPPWPVKSDLPDLATAVHLQRLSNEAFPKPGEDVATEYEGASLRGPVEYSFDFPSDVTVGGRTLPLWRFMVALGRLA